MHLKEPQPEPPGINRDSTRKGHTVDRERFQKQVDFILEIDQIMETEGGNPIYKAKGYNTLVFDNNGLDKLERLKEAETDVAWPKVGDSYWIVKDDGSIVRLRYDGSAIDEQLMKVGNMFRTEFEAKERSSLTKWAATDPARWKKITIWKELEPYTNPDGRYALRLEDDGMVVAARCDANFGGPRFLSPAVAERALYVIGQERMKVDWFGVE